MKDIRYVYLMKRDPPPIWQRIGKLDFRSEYKIGIAKNVRSRRASVDASLKRRVRVICQAKVLNAKRCESRLHEVYKKYRFTQKRAGSGAGKTEWFYLNEMDVLRIRITLWWYWFWPRLIGFILFWMIIFFIATYS